MVEDKVLIFDDLIHPKIQDQLLFFSQKISYNINRATTSYSNSEVQNINNLYEQFQLVKSLDGKTNNPYLYLLPLVSVLSVIGVVFDVEKLLRVRINTQTQALGDTKDKYNFPHYDNKNNLEKQIVVLYYINDADSNTYTFSNKLDMEDPNYMQKINNLEIDNKIETKRGRIVLFRGDKLHAGQHPTNTLMRHVINYNYLLDT